MPVNHVTRDGKEASNAERKETNRTGVSAHYQKLWPVKQKAFICLY